MGYQPLFISCNCGTVPTRLGEIGFTSDHELVVHWWCETCGKVEWKAMTLDACIAACPATAGHNDDEGFLHSIGVRMPDDEQAA